MDEAVKRNYASSVARVRVNHKIISTRISWKHTASDFVMIENQMQYFLSLARDSSYISLLFFLRGIAIIS